MGHIIFVTTTHLHQTSMINSHGWDMNEGTGLCSNKSFIYRHWNLTSTYFSHVMKFHSSFDFPPQPFTNANTILSLRLWKTGGGPELPHRPQSAHPCTKPTPLTERNSHSGAQTPKELEPGTQRFIKRWGSWSFQTTYIHLSLPPPPPSFLSPLCLSNTPLLKSEVQVAALVPGRQTYLLFDFLELPALLSDIMEKLKCFVILLGHLHPCLLQTSL